MLIEIYEGLTEAGTLVSYICTKCETYRSILLGSGICPVCGNGGEVKKLIELPTIWRDTL